MFDMILSAIGGWKIKLLAAGLAVAVVGGYVLYLRADAADARADAAQLRANVAVLEETNRRTVESFRRYQAEQERARAALVREAERAATRASERAALISEAENAPDDRIAGPVIQRGFDRLRAMEGTAGGGGNPDGEDHTP